MSRFADIMLHLNPRVIIEKTEAPHDRIRGSITLESSIVGSYREFEDIIIAYTSYHMQQTLGNFPPNDYALDKARKFLDASIGFDNSVFMGMSGSEGGMYNVINQICDGFKQEARQAYFSYIVDTFIDPLSFTETVELMREFKARLGAYSPQSFGYVSPEQMASNYKAILYNYIESLTRYRNQWAY